jgi:hypothetical protein
VCVGLRRLAELALVLAELALNQLRKIPQLIQRAPFRYYRMRE